MDPRLLKQQAPDFMGPPEPIAPLAPIAAPMPEAPVAPPAADTPAAPDFDFSKLMVTPEDLKERAEAKRRNAMMGGVGEALSNMSSFGHAFLGRQPVKHDFSDTTKALDELADAPIEGKQALLKQELQKPELEYMRQAIRPDSEVSNMGRQLARMQLANVQRTLGRSNPQLSGTLAMLDKNLDRMSQFEIEKQMTPIMKVLGDQGLQLSKAELTAALAGRRIDQADTRIGMDANKDYSKELGSAEAQIKNANRILALTNKIKAALSNPNDPEAVKATRQLRSDLSGALASMVNGGKPATVYGMSHQDFDSYYGKVQDFLSKFGDPKGTMTPEQIQQLENDVKAMREEYGLSHEISFKAFQEGLPTSVRGPLQKRFDKFRGEALTQGGGEKPAPSSFGIPGVPEANASVSTTPGAGMKTQPAGLSAQDLEAIKAIQEQMKLPKEQRDPNLERALLKVTQKMNGGQ